LQNPRIGWWLATLNTLNLMKNCGPQPGVWNCSSRVYWACPEAELGGVNAERVSLLVSCAEGATSAVSGSSSELKPSIRHNTITSSWHARERMLSPKKVTLPKELS